MPSPSRRRRAELAARVAELVGAHAPGPDDRSADSSARTFRWDPGRRGLLALGAAAVLALLVTLVWVASARPRAEAVPGGVSAVSVAPSSLGTPSASGSAGPSAVTSPTAPSTGSSAAAGVVVDVVGRVRRPGVYRFAAGARVDDAVRSAGGALPGTDLTTLNLARVLVDGEQVAVGVSGATDAAPPPAVDVPSGSAGSGGVVDLNTATLEQLDGLPGVGPVLAQNILDWRTAHGRFTSVGQLSDVTGIGPSKLATLTPRVTV